MKKIIAVISFLVIALPVVGQQRFNEDVENAGADCPVTLPNSFTTPNSALPDPFMKLDGTRITTKEEWVCHRQEILRLAERTIYGVKPPKPSSVTGSVSATSISVTVSNNGGTPRTFSASISNMPSGAGPHPAIISYGNSGVTGGNVPSGVALINFTATTVGAENQGSTNNRARSGVFFDIYGTNHEAGTLIAWAWGVSRIIDVIEADPNRRIDPTAIAVTGCSRFGKGPFVAAAFDQRIALALPMEGGTGGTNLLRMAATTSGAQSPSSAYGEQPWLGNPFNTFQNSVNNLPVDMHSVIGLIAPRGALFLDKTPESSDWLATQASYAAAVAGAEIYKALGVGSHLHYIGNTNDSRPSGQMAHCSWDAQYNTPLANFTNMFLRRTVAPSGNTPTLSRSNSSRYPSTATMNSYINWTTPTLTGDLVIGGVKLPGFTLSTAVNPANAGTVTLSPARPANGRYEEGTPVTITRPAPAAAEWEFVSWSGGGCSGTSSTCVVTMNQNQTVTVTYKRPDGFIDPTNLIQNGTFATTANWTRQQHQGTATFAVSNNTANLTAITPASGAPDHALQLIQNGITLTQGLTYRLTFEASAASTRTMGVVIEMDVSPFTSYMTPQTANLTTAMQQFTYTFTMNAATDENSRVTFNVGGATPNVQIRNAALVQVASTSIISGVPAAKIQNSKLHAAALPNRTVNVSFRADSDGTATLRLYNLRGNLISSQKLQTAAGTNYSHTFNPGKLPNGFYIVNLYNGGTVEQTRVMIHR